MDRNNIYKSDEDIDTVIDVDSFENHDKLLYSNYDTISDSSSHYDLSLDNDSPITIEEDDDEILLSEASSCESIEIKKKSNKLCNLNKSTEQRKRASNSFVGVEEVELFDQQVPIKKKCVPAVLISTSKQENVSVRQGKNNLLNLEKIAIPKTKLSNVKLNPSIFSSQIKKKSISFVPTATIVKSTIPITKLQSGSNATAIGCNIGNVKSSFCESKSNSYIVPHNGVNYLIKKTKEESKHNLSNKSTSSTVKSIDTAAKLVRQKEKIIISPKTTQNVQQKNNSEFVARVEKLPGGKFKMVPAQGKVPIGLQNIFRRNAQFIKQKVPTGSRAGINNDVIVQKSSENIHLTSNPHSGQQKRQILPKKFSISMNREKKRAFQPITIRRNTIKYHYNHIDDDTIQMQLENRESHVLTNFIHHSSKSDSLTQLDDQSLVINNFGDITKRDLFNKSKIKPSSSTKIKSSMTKFMIDSDDSESSIKSITTDDRIKPLCRKRFPSKDRIENVFKTKLSQVIMEEELDDIFDEEDEKSGQIVSCHYQYCHTLVHEPELIDSLYCSAICKHLHSQQMTIEDEPTHDFEENISPPKNSDIEKKQSLAKIESRTNKRKQVLVCSSEKKNAQNDDWNELEQFDNSCNEAPIDTNVSSQNSPDCTIFSSSDIDDDDDDGKIDFKLYVKNDNICMYLDEMEYWGAPNNLFDKPFPKESNLFQIGQKLEGIDPEHEALFCVMTVVNVCGYRIKLHFDGYPDAYDFWVNADCPDLFYAGWCEKNSKILQPPKNYVNQFNWTDYLRASNAFPAPNQNFASTKILANPKTKHLFRIGDKLEALDILTRTLPKQIICVATVADVIGNRIRIHYDGWTNDYDCWMNVTSPNIHPVGWCEGNYRSLAKPSGYNDLRGKKPFNWTEYLKETNSKPVPEEAFLRRPLRDFMNKMTLETVDVANPSLIRIAKVVDARGDELKIVYDGFDMKYAYWVEDDSPDIHPVGWSVVTKHPIEIPPANNMLWKCGIFGCRGIGNISITETTHDSLKDCPYEFEAWEKSISGLAKLLGRIKKEDILVNLPVSSSKPETIKHSASEKKDKLKSNSVASNNLNLVKCNEKIMNHKPKELLDEKNIIEIDSSDSDSDVSEKDYQFEETNDVGRDRKLCNDIVLSIIPNDVAHSSLASKECTEHYAQLGLPLLDTIDSRTWSVQQVATYVDQIVTMNSNNDSNKLSSVSKCFIKHQIDGEGFLMLSIEDIMNVINIPFGHAIKIYSAITMLRQKVPAFDLVDASTSHCIKK